MTTAQAVQAKRIADNLQLALDGGRQCQHCGKWYKPTQKQQKYCSRRCTSTAAALRYYYRHHEDKLAYQAEYHFNHREKCKAQMSERRAQKRSDLKLLAELFGDVKKICPVCGKEFTPKTCQKYCSPECVEAWRKEYRHQYHMAHKAKEAEK